MHREDLLRLLDEYSTSYMDEAGYVQRAKRWIVANTEIFERAQSIHVTASAWVVNPSMTRVFMVHHGKLHQWFQPGGHADGDSDVIRVALREVTEESGIDPACINLLSGRVFDVDIHTVPDTVKAPAHGHIDIRFLVQADDTVPAPGSDESHEVRWIDLHNVSTFNNNRSTWRMLEKTRQLRRLRQHGKPVDNFEVWASRRAL